MKTKLFLLALIGYLTTMPVIADKTKLVTDKAIETAYWYFTKDRLFDRERPVVASFQNNIYFQLQCASKQDSLIVKNMIHELHLLIPHRKIAFYTFNPDSIDEANELVTIYFGKVFKEKSDRYVKRSKNINGNQIFYEGFKGVYQPDIFWQHISLTFNDSISYSERKQYIEYAVIRSLCNIKGKREDAHTTSKGAILNDFDYNPVGTTFSEVDKFLIRKLYSKDFQKQFRKFMLENYPLRYYLVFTHKDTMQTIGSFSIIFLIILILILTYKPVFIKEYNKKYLNYIIPGLLVANSMSIIVVTFMSITTKAEWFNDYFIVLAGINIISIILSFVLYFVEKLIIKPSYNKSTQIVLKSVMLLILVSVPILIVSIYISTKHKNVDFSFFITTLILGVVLATGRGMILYFKHIQKSLILAKDVELSKLKELKTRAEMEALHARINPHFLYNSLNSIAGLADEDSEKTKKMALALSDMFRYTINRNNELMSNIKDELKMVRSYLEIEQIRFGDRMRFAIDVDKELEMQEIPKFVLLPLVENAVKHGISKIEGEGNISLSIKKIAESIEIKVTDNGPKFPDGLINGYGLQSINDLLKLNYGENIEMFWQNNPEKLICIKIRIIS